MGVIVTSLCPQQFHFIFSWWPPEQQWEMGAGRWKIPGLYQDPGNHNITPSSKRKKQLLEHKFINLPVLNKLMGRKASLLLMTTVSLHSATHLPVLLLCFLLFYRWEGLLNRYRDRKKQPNMANFNGAVKDKKQGQKTQG